MIKQHFQAFAFLGLLSSLAACQKEQLPIADATRLNTANISFDAQASAAFSSTDWRTGLLEVSSDISKRIVPISELKPLNVTFGGPSIFKSNNPEIFTGLGWLMQNARVDATRGGRSLGLSGTHPLYLFHLNKSGGTRYAHIIVTNPNAYSISVSGKGSYYNNTEKPLTGAATGQSYWVARDWMTNTLRLPSTKAVSIAQYKATQIARITINNNNMVDGRFEITTNGPAYYYVVITSTGTTNDAISRSQGSFAAGEYKTESATTFGREAGVYEYSEVTANNTLDLPDTPSNIGFALNTTNKYIATLENQNANALFNLTGASSKSYGNYGMKYNVKIQLNNANATAKTVKVYFASCAVDATKSNATWNGAVRLNGTLFNVYTQFNNPRQQLATWTVNPGSFNATLDFVIPGLITTNQQLIFEVQ